MLDPKEQAKGGFGARVEREKDRRAALAEARREAAASGTTPDAADAPDGAPGSDSQADGEQPDADGERSPYAPTPREPKRWR